MTRNPVTDFENALIELIYMHMEHGLSGKDVHRVLIARMDDDFEAGHQELMRERANPEFPNNPDLTKVVGGPQTEAVERLGKAGA